MSSELNRKIGSRTFFPGMVRPGPRLKANLTSLQAVLRLQHRREMREAADLIDVAFARQTEPRKIKKEPTGMKEEEETTKIQHLRKIPTNAIGAWIAEGAQTIPTKKNCDEERMRLFERIGMFDGTGEINRTELEDALTEPTYEATRNFITLKAIQHRHQESATREQQTNRCIMFSQWPCWIGIRWLCLENAWNTRDQSIGWDHVCSGICDERCSKRRDRREMRLSDDSQTSK